MEDTDKNQISLMKLLEGFADNHERGLVKIKNKVNQCHYCEKTFTQGGSLKRHIVRVHKIVEGSIGKYASTCFFTCNYCGKEMKRHNKKAHLFKVHGIGMLRTVNKKLVKCEICGKLVAQIHNHRKIHKIREGIPCKECGKILIDKTSLNSHQLVHQKPKYNCKHCETNFTQTGSLKRHMVQVHGVVEGKIGQYDKRKGNDKKEMHACKECNALILEADSDFHMYKEHGVKNVNSIQKHYCTICGKIVHHLSKHKKFYHNVELHECLKCGQHFKYLSSLKSHIQQVHSDVFYHCNICDKK